LAFTRFTSVQNSSVWIADRDGSNARQIAADGDSGTLSPDGRQVAYFVAPKGGQGFPILFVLRVAGGRPRRIGASAGVRVWSPDSRRLAISDGKALFLVDTGSGERRCLARGRVYLGGVSFAPDGNSVAYSRAGRGVGHLYRSDIFVVRISDGQMRQLTHDAHSDMPVWGRSWIVFRSFHFAGDWSIGRLRLMRRDGSDDRAFARGGERTSLAQMGLDPIAFSDNGKHLLACQAFEFNCAPLTFTVPGVERHAIVVERRPGELATAADLSRDGTHVLVDVGPFDGPLHHRVYAVPFGGGTPKLLVREATDPSWAH
jgi:dipeptidyl aminopeptidase/acylaminoacyl peptidase